MLETRKIIVDIPISLLDNAMQETGKDVAETICTGLESLARKHAYKGILDLQGKVKPCYSLEILRHDRE